MLDVPSKQLKSTLNKKKNSIMVWFLVGDFDLKESQLIRILMLMVSLDVASPLKEPPYKSFF